MQIHAASLRRDIAGPLAAPSAVLSALPAGTTAEPILPEWISDTFAAKYATRALHRAGNTAVGSLIQTVLNDPFVFINQKLKIGGINGSMAAASATVTAGAVAPNRAIGTIIGATIGALTGAGQAMMTLPSTTAVVTCAIHGVVRGAIAGNVAVAERTMSSHAVLRTADRLW